MKNLKFIKLKLVLWVCFSLLMATQSSAQESSAEFNINAGTDVQLIEKYKKMIADRKADLMIIAETVGEIRNCHNQKLIYTSSGCANPVTPESDPSKALHASSATPIPTCPTGYGQTWNGSSWTCKEIRKTVNSGVPADTGTWQLINAESCWDHFMRKCTSGDDTCPTSGNPLGVACSPQPFCRYAENNANHFMEFMCK